VGRRALLLLLLLLALLALTAVPAVAAVRGCDRGLLSFDDDDAPGGLRLARVKQTPDDVPPPAIARDDAPLPLRLVEVASGFDRPLLATHAGDGTKRLFVVEQTGRIWIVRDGERAKRPFFDARPIVGPTGGEQGLLGLAFHPAHAKNGALYVASTTTSSKNAVSRLQVSADRDVVDARSLRVLLEMDDPAGNHNGGMLAFGKDGLLYVGTGDGGGGGDPWKNGQNPRTLLGKMLRLDVDKEGSKPEIWAIGLRNPWRYSFDRATGELYIGDVGQNEFEEVHVVDPKKPAPNFGWSVLEGAHCYPSDKKCKAKGMELPVFEYGRGDGCSITGGYVYRGKRFAGLVGRYLVGDYCSGNIWALRRVDGAWRVKKALETKRRISSFGEDEDGEIYVVDHDGAVLRVELAAR